MPVSCALRAFARYALLRAMTHLLALSFFESRIMEGWLYMDLFERFNKKCGSTNAKRSKMFQVELKVLACSIPFLQGHAGTDSGMHAPDTPR